jgi:hypothetical protein
VTYTVNPKQNLATGTRVNAQATVVFDTNAPIQTAQLFNTIESSPPTSSVNPLPANTTSTSFPVSWTGSDGAGSGIGSYDVEVSDNGGPFTPFLTDTTQTSATFAGQVGHVYSFYSVATSNIGLVQPTPTSAQATTAVRLAPATPGAPTLLPAESTGSPGGETTYSRSPVLTGTTFAGATVQLLNASGTVLNTAKANGAGAYQVQVPGPLSVEAYSFRVDAIDQYGDVSSPSTAVTINVVNPLAPLVDKTTLTTKKGSIQSITVSFSEPMTTSSADSSVNFTLVDAGRTHIFGARGNTGVSVKNIIYNSANDSATITLAKSVRTRDSLRLTINAQPPSGLQGTNGQFLNASANGAPGQNPVIYLGAPPKTPRPPRSPRKKKTKDEILHVAVTRKSPPDALATSDANPITGRAQVRVSARADERVRINNEHPTDTAAIVDAVLARVDLVELFASLRSKAGARTFTHVTKLGDRAAVDLFNRRNSRRNLSGKAGPNPS